MALSLRPSVSQDTIQQAELEVYLLAAALHASSAHAAVSRPHAVIHISTAVWSLQPLTDRKSNVACTSMSVQRPEIANQASYSMGTPSMRVPQYPQYAHQACSAHPLSMM